jgi:RNA polymerase sigma-70 factor (ECF subfamily)
MPRNSVAAIRTEGKAALQAVPDDAGADETALVQRACRGDREAFRTLTERHLASVVGISRRMLHDDSEAEDVAQETFLRLWRLGATLEIGSHGVRPWLRRVASNLCIDRMRGRQRVSVVEELPEVPDAPRQLAGLEASETQRRVDEALKALPDRQRQALVLFHFEGMSQVEVGEVMGISDEAVESLLARARRQLKTALQSEWRELIGKDGA